MTIRNISGLIVWLTLNIPISVQKDHWHWERKHTDDMTWIEETLALIFIVEVLGNESFGASKDLNILLHVRPIGVFVKGKRIIGIGSG